MLRYDVINALIEKFGYGQYLEIGVRNGECLRAVRALVKDGVDPDASQCPDGINYPMPSDDFFAALSADRRYDIVFIDGLHQKEQVLRDIENSLAHLSPGGTIVVHDCNPPMEYNASHESNGGNWNGTVYQAIIDLRARRADLDVFTVDTDWGIGVIRRGSSPTLDASLAQASMVDFNVFDSNRSTVLNLISTDQFQNWLSQQSA